MHMYLHISMDMNIVFIRNRTLKSAGIIQTRRNIIGYRNSNFVISGKCLIFSKLKYSKK